MENNENQIERVMKSAFASLKEMADVNTVIGAPYTNIDGTVMVPVSKVTMAFLAGGGEYSAGEKSVDAIRKPNFPVSAGSGGYVQLTPIGFLVGSGDKMTTITMDEKQSGSDKLFKALADYLKKKSEEKDEK